MAALFRAALAGAVFLCAAAISPRAVAAPKASDLVQAELVTEPRAIEPGKTFTVAVRLSMKEHWHTYWRNPGDSGLATEIAWTLPAGFSAGPIQWPVPERIPVAHLVNYGYDGETALLVDITPSASLPAGRSVELKAKVSYLVCERECIPGEADLSASLPVAASGGGGSDPTIRYVFDAARATLPKPAPWPVRAEASGDAVTLRVEASGLRPETSKSAYFFAAEETAIDHAAPQLLTVDGSGLTLRMTASPVASAPARPDMPGVLVLDEDTGGATVRQAFQVGIMPAAASSSAGSLPTSAPVPVDLGLGTVATILLFGFLGGLVLNLMPCVFPVLSIKVMSLVRHSGQGAGAIRASGLAYGAGVVASFLALAGLLLALRGAGQEIGWGFQLQSPALVVALIFLLAGVGLSLSGLVEFGTGLAARAGSVSARDGIGGSFLTGVLAAIVATPCTAPFMGVAIGYALTAPAPLALAVFAALGLGLAAPFLVLTISPGLLVRMPRPGAWMEVLKQVLAFPIYATVAWLLFVLSQQVGPNGLFAALLGLVLVGFGLWSWRVASTSSGIGRRVGHGAALASLVALLAVGWAVAQDAGAGSGDVGRSAATSGAERFSQIRLDTLRGEGRPVFVNMTAAWCITCLVNERAVLSTAAIKAGFADKGIAYLKGDWTNQNPEITRLLEQHGRSGVPLYVLYPGRGEPIVLPQILTESVVLDGLARIDASVRRAALSPPKTISQE